MKILCYCDFGCSTGFARVAENILYRLTETKSHVNHFDVCGVNYFGEQTEINENLTLFSALEYRIEKDQDPLGRTSVIRLLRERHYDALFIISDLQVIAPMYGPLADLKRSIKASGRNIKYIFYFPVDSPPKAGDVVHTHPVQQKLQVGLHNFDEIITYTYYGKKQVLDIVKEYSTVNYLKLKEKIKVIPHGTDKDKYYHIDKTDSDLREFRNKYFRCNNDSFIIGQVNRNSARKDYPTSLQAYKKFLDTLKKDIPDQYEKTIYYLHCNPLDPEGYNLFNVCEALEIPKGKVLMPSPNFNENQGVDEKTLNLIYNSLDLFFTTTTAEGWGLTILEAMACEIPVVAPFHTSIAEIFTDKSIEASTITAFRQSFMIQDGEYIRFQSDADNAAAMLLEQLSSPLTEDNLMDNAKAAKSFDWNNICLEWRKVFNLSSLIVLK